MKLNKKVLLAGAALLSFAACKTEMKQPTDAEIDVVVTEKVNEVKQQLQADCDASLLAAANANADAILVAAANKPAVTRTVTTAPAAKPKPRPTAKPTPKPIKKEPVNTNSKNNKMQGNAKSNVDGKKSKMAGEQTKKAIDNVNDKKSKMNRNR